MPTEIPNPMPAADTAAADTAAADTAAADTAAADTRSPPPTGADAAGFDRLPSGNQLPNESHPRHRRAPSGRADDLPARRDHPRRREPARGPDRRRPAPADRGTLHR